MKPMEVVAPATRKTLRFLGRFKKKLEAVLGQYEVFLHFQFVWMFATTASTSSPAESQAEEKPIGAA